MKNCIKAIKEYKTKWARREKVDTRVLNEWEGTVTSIVKTRIERIRHKHKQSYRQYRKQVLRDKAHLKYLSELHEEYVLVPADKAGNNVLVVCKKYYLDVVIRELINKNKTGPNTYIECNDSIDQLLKEHVQYMNTNNIKIPEVMMQLPTFYWLPKMHKTPVGSRFIAASSSCTTKPLSKLLTSCLNLIIQHFKEYNEGIIRNSGANCFWIINNSTQVLNKLNKLNNTTIATHFDSFDFSTLYTNIPHDLLLDCLDNLVKEAYRVRGATYISAGHNVFWSDKAYRGHTNITVDKLIEYIQFLINNIYVKVGNRVFKQTIGIPMGTDCAPLLANLFLFFYEYKYVKDKLKDNHKQARLVKHTH